MGREHPQPQKSHTIGQFWHPLQAIGLIIGFTLPHPPPDKLALPHPATAHPADLHYDAAVFPRPHRTPRDA